MPHTSGFLSHRALPMRCFHDVIARVTRSGESQMSIIDRQRVAAVAKLEALGYTDALATGWSPCVDSAPGLVPSTAEADAMHAALMRRADALEGCTEGSPEEDELRAITDVIEAYAAQRWPDGKEAGGKG